MCFCWKNGLLHGIAGGIAQSAVNPRLKIGDGVKDAATELAVSWACAVAAMLFQRTVTKSQKVCGLLGRQKCRLGPGQGCHDLHPLQRRPLRSSRMGWGLRGGRAGETPPDGSEVDLTVACATHA